MQLAKPALGRACGVSFLKEKIGGGGGVESKDPGKDQGPSQGPQKKNIIIN